MDMRGRMVVVAAAARCGLLGADWAVVVGQELTLVDTQEDTHHKGDGGVAEDAQAAVAARRREEEGVVVVSHRLSAYRHLSTHEQAACREEGQVDRVPMAVAEEERALMCSWGREVVAAGEEAARCCCKRGEGAGHLPARR